MPPPLTPSPVGFVGLGKMGAPMVARLCASGFPVHAYDVAPAAARAVRDLDGCVVASSLAAVAEAVDTVITMLPDGEIVRRAVLGGGDGGAGLADALVPGSLVIDMSSSAPDQTRRLGAELADRDVSLVDAPVSGGVARAVDGRLSIFVGGEPAHVERARPVLQAIGSRLFDAGPLGAGHTAKALNNLLSAACFAATVEVLEIARAAGLDPAVFTEIIDASSGRNNTTENKLRQFVLPETYDSGFALGLMAKDLGIADELAAGASLSVPVSRQVVQRWVEASRELGADADHTEYARTVRRPSSAPAADRGSID